MDGEVRVLFFGFRTSEWERRAQGIFRNLQARNRISREIEIIYLPADVPVPVRGIEYFCFVLIVPLDEDLQATTRVLTRVIGERLSIEVYEADLPEAQHMYTPVVMHILQRDSE